MIIGSKIREVRIHRGMQQIELARKAKISNTYLSDIENNRTTPSLKTLSKIANALEIYFDWDIFLNCENNSERFHANC